MSASDVKAHALADDEEWRRLKAIRDEAEAGLYAMHSRVDTLISEITANQERIDSLRASIIEAERARLSIKRALVTANQEQTRNTAAFRTAAYALYVYETDYVDTFPMGWVTIEDIDAALDGTLDGATDGSLPSS